MQFAIVFDKADANVLLMAIQHLESYSEISLDDSVEDFVLEEFKTKLKAITGKK